MNTAAMERTDLGNHSARTINMTRLGEALTDDRRSAGEGAHRLQLQSRLHRARSRNRPARPAARGSLHRRPRTFPDRYRRLRRRPAAGDDAARARRSAQGVRPSSTRRTTAARSRRSARRCRTARSSAASPRRWISIIPELRESDEDLMRAALTGTGEVMNGVTLEALREHGSVRLNVPSPHLPFRRGTKVPTPSGKIEIESQQIAALGLDPLPTYVPPYESEERAPELARRFPLALHLAACALVPQLDPSSMSLRCGVPPASRRWKFTRTMRGAIDRRWRAREDLQRPRHLHRRRRRHRSRPPRRRLRAVGVVGPISPRTARTRTRRRRRR